MEKIISHVFGLDKTPENWSFLGLLGKSSMYAFRDDGLLIDGRLTIPFYGKAWGKFKVEIEVVPVAGEVSLECFDESRVIRVGLRSPIFFSHKIYRNLTACPIAESNTSVIPQKGSRLVVFEFDHGKMRGFVDDREVITAVDPEPQPVFGRVIMNFWGETLVKRLDIFADDALNVPVLPPRKSGEFHLEVAVDFCDDLDYAAFDRNMFDKLFRELKSWGTKRVQWIDHGNKKFGWWDHVPEGDITVNYSKTHAAVGDVIRAAVDAAHSRDIELYGVFKPFDVGIQHSFGEGTPEAIKYGKIMRVGGPVDWIMDFAADHQEYLMARKPVNFGQIKNNVINRIDLVKEDDQSPDITMDDIEIWVSNDNATYQLYRGPMEKRETIEDYPLWEHTSSGGRLTGEKKRCVVFRLENMKINEKYIALVCRKIANSFGNTLVNLIHVFDEKGEERLVTYGAVPRLGDQTEYSQRKARFQEVGIEFDKYPGAPTGWRPCSDGIRRRFVLDTAQGLLAIAKGKDRGELAALSPSFVATRDFWLEVVDEMLAAGVDGVDLRFANHQWTFTWDEFGFEDPVVDEFKKRYGIDLRNTDDFDRAALRRLRGEAYTQFYREAKQLVARHRKKMGLHIEPWMDVEPEIGGAMGMHLDWRTWLKEGLADSITMKDVRPHSRFAHEILTYTRPRGIPVVYSLWNSLWGGNENIQLTRNAITEAQEGGYNGFQFYESSAVVKGTSAGDLIMEQPALREVFGEFFCNKKHIQRSNKLL